MVPLFGRAEPYLQFVVEGIMKNISVKIILNLDEWLYRCGLNIFLI